MTLPAANKGIIEIHKISDRMSASHARIKRTVRVVLILMAAYCTTMGCTAPMLDSSKFLSRVDHLVYGTPDLEASIRHLEEVLGVKAGHGGQHPGQGTRNAVLALGPTSYLEIIGLDPEQPEPDRPRWLGIDDLDAPRLVTWAAKGQALGSVVNQAAQANVRLGSVLSGRRDRPDGSALHWKLTDPHQVVDDGIVPFFIDWGGSPRPQIAGLADVEHQPLTVLHQVYARRFWESRDQRS